jgi:hypothetical protein
MIRRVLLSLVFGFGVVADVAAAAPITVIEFEITFADGSKAQMTTTDPHFVPMELPTGSAGVYLMTNPADHTTVGVVFYRVTFTAPDLFLAGPLQRQQTQTELGRDVMKVGGEPILSKTDTPFHIRITKVVDQER